MAQKRAQDEIVAPGDDIAAGAIEPTSRDRRLADLAEANRKIEPQCYDITNKNTKTPRVVYDHSGRSVMIEPGGTKSRIWLQPGLAERLNRNDLEFTAAS